VSESEQHPTILKKNKRQLTKKKLNPGSFRKLKNQLNPIIPKKTKAKKKN
jgi:hypothetical protein